MTTQNTYLKAMSLLGETGSGGNVARIDVKDGKIYSLKVEKQGYQAKEFKDVDASKDVNVGDIELSRVAG